MVGLVVNALRTVPKVFTLKMGFVRIYNVQADQMHAQHNAICMSMPKEQFAYVLMAITE